MTYKLASSIRRMVEHLNETWAHDHYVCAIVNEFGGKDNWECHLFNKNYDRGFEGEMWALALAIEKAGFCITANTSYYNQGTTEPDYVKTICLS